MSGIEPYILWMLAGMLIVVGIAGTVLPALPGVVLVLSGLFLAAWIENFQKIGWPTLTILLILSALAIAIDLIASLLGAKRAEASKLALLGAALGSITGLFFGLIGIFIFPFIGAFIGEVIARGNMNNAARVGLATWLGLVIGTLVKLAIVFTMVGVSAVAYFF